MTIGSARLTKIRIGLVAVALLVALILAVRARGQQSSNSAAAASAANQSTQPAAAHAARPDDVKSIDAIIAALYDVISGPPGDRDWDRFRSLFIPEGRLLPVTAARDGSGNQSLLVWRVEDYVTRDAPYFKQNAFFEREVSRKQEQFGHIAEVFSTYESRHAKDEQPFARGINSIELFNDGQRWWIVHVMWDSERPGQSIPQKYLQSP